MLKPRFSLWGYLVGDHVRGPWATCDVPNLVPDQLGALLDIPVESAPDFVTEGGDKSFNGRGTVIMSRAVERQRHPGLSDAQIESLARTHLRARHGGRLHGGGDPRGRLRHRRRAPNRLERTGPSARLHDRAVHAADGRVWRRASQATNRARSSTTCPA